MPGRFRKDFNGQKDPINMDASGAIFRPGGLQEVDPAIEFNDCPDSPNRPPCECPMLTAKVSRR